MNKKCEKNPIIKVSDLKPSLENYKILGVFNPGVTEYRGKTVLLMRVAEVPINDDPSKVIAPIYDVQKKRIMLREFDANDKNYDFSDRRVIKSKHDKCYLTSISHLRLGFSDNGFDFEIEDKPFIQAFDEYTTFGIEDPRITKIDDIYYISFSGASNYGIVTKLVKTKDFKTYEDMGNIFHPDNKDVAIFPKKFSGKYYALHRPSTSDFSAPNMWIAQSNDLVCWGGHKLIASVRENKWDSCRIGASAIPFLTEKGFIEIYHGATHDNRYCLGAMLLDKYNPEIVIKRSIKPLVEPTEEYELKGFFGNVVFSCGLLEYKDFVRIYYGAADDSIACVDISIDDIYKNLEI